MARLKKKAKRKKKQDLAPISKEEQDRLDSVLTNLSEVDLHHIREQIDSPALAARLLERLPADAPESVNLILAVRDAFEQKEVQKAVKKAIFKLRRQGISFPEPEEPRKKSVITEAPRTPEPEAFVGPIDGTGTRGVLIVLPQLPKGVDTGIGLIHSENGIMQFVYSRNSKKRSKEIKTVFHEQVGKAVETSLSHAATLMEKAYEKGSALGENSRDYLRIRPWILENVPLREEPVIRDFISEEDITGEVLTNSRINKLLDHELMATWIIPPDKIQPLLEEISKAEESPIIMSDEQKAERLDEIKEKAIAETYPESKRRLLKEDLEEMAYIFFKRDEEKYARICLLAADDVKEKESPLRTDTFLRAYLEHSLAYYYQALKENSGPKAPVEESSPTITTP